MRSKGDGGLFRAEGFRHALLGNGIATQVSAELEANIRGVVVARYNRGAPLRKPVTCSALPRTPPVRILHVYVYPPRDGIIVTCSGEPRTRSSSTNDRLSSGGGGDDTFLLFSRSSRTKSWADRNLPSSPSISFLFLIPFRAGHTLDRIEGKIRLDEVFRRGKLRMRRIVPISMPRK